jgi:hypothetical protein
MFEAIDLMLAIRKQIIRRTNSIGAKDESRKFDFV